MLDRRYFARMLLLVGFCAGCPSGLPDPPSRPSDAGTSAFELEPEAPLDAASRVVRIHWSDPDPSDAGTALRVFRGALSAYDLGRIRRGEISTTLAERRVAVLDYREDGDRVLAPLDVLDPGQTYSVADDDGALVGTFSVAPSAAPALARVWPPLDGGGGVEHVVYCGDAGALAAAHDVVLEPTGIAARISPGAGSDPDSSGCVHLSAATAPGSGTIEIPPPQIEGRALDPAPLMDKSGPLLAALPCSADEIEFGAGCARVSDDRIQLRSANESLFWILSGAVALVRPASAGEVLQIGGLAPDTEHHVEVEMIDLASRSYVTAVDFRTLASSPHVVINEVLANAVGPEPAQEWVELFNDGRTAVDLEGWTLEDVGGIALLPADSLAPGQFAVVVGDTYDAASGYDVAPAPGTVLLRVPHVGKNGLSNSGEPLRLVSPDGQAESSFPAVAAARAGVSIARRDPATPDADLTGFGEHASPGASPGAPNVLGP